MSMVNLARSPVEVKRETAMAVPAAKPMAAEFPYGCCISLDDECLTKLGLDGDLPAAGEMIHFEAMAKVTCASVRDEVDADGTSRQCRRVELQITDMGMIGAEATPRADRWYKNGEPDGDE
jgi:major coat protein